jgi:hypothetical protein
VPYKQEHDGQPDDERQEKSRHARLQDENIAPLARFAKVFHRTLTAQPPAASMRGIR